MIGTMKANIFYEKESMSLKEMEIPHIAENEVLIRVRACGICGSDVSYYYGLSPLETPDGKGPLVLGHEISGEVVEIGATVARKGLLQVGDHVVVNPPQPCMNCVSCLNTHVNLCENTETVGVSCNGGFAEYVKVNYTNVYRVSDTVDWEEAAMCEPLACSCNGVRNLDVKLGDTVLVIGAGSIGLMMAQLIRMEGAGKVIVSGTSDFALETARNVGADYTFNTRETSSPYYTDDISAAVKSVNNGMLADKVIVAVAKKPAYDDAFRASGKASTIVFFGLPGGTDVIEVPALASLTSNKTIKFSWLAPFSWDMALKALVSGKLQLKPLITHIFPLEQVEEGIQFMHSRQPGKIKGMIVMR